MMKTWLFVGAFALGSSWAFAQIAPIAPIDSIPPVGGGTSPRIYAPDGTYLGNLNSNRYDPDSVSNPYGQYGSRYSPNSINNPYGQYGRRYSPNGVRNPYGN
jgi:hypothetical protein